jgi:hypothetical protein
MLQEQQRLLCRGRPPNSWGGREGPPGQMPPLNRQQDYYAFFGVKAAEAVDGRGMPGGEEVAVAVGSSSSNKHKKQRDLERGGEGDKETRLKNQD